VPIEVIMENMGYIMLRTKQGSSIYPGDDETLAIYLSPDDEELKLFKRIKNLSSPSKQTVLELVNSLEIIEKTKKEQSALSETEVG
jgi:hypothetical protein